MKYTDVVFSCRKCGHLLYLKKEQSAESLCKKLIHLDCPMCGEEAGENWVFQKFGNYEKEYGTEVVKE